MQVHFIVVWHQNWKKNCEIYFYFTRVNQRWELESTHTADAGAISMLWLPTWEQRVMMQIVWTIQLQGAHAGVVKRSNNAGVQEKNRY